MGLEIWIKGASASERDLVSTMKDVTDLGAGFGKGGRDQRAGAVGDEQDTVLKEGQNGVVAVCH